MTSSLIADILFGFTALISIINPFAIAFVFLDRTESLSREERAALARRVSINALIAANKVGISDFCTQNDRPEAK